jgi:hypothetical protein
MLSRGKKKLSKMYEQNFSFNVAGLKTLYFFVISGGDTNIKRHLLLCIAASLSAPPYTGSISFPFLRETHRTTQNHSALTRQIYRLAGTVRSWVNLCLSEDMIQQFIMTDDG